MGTTLPDSEQRFENRTLGDEDEGMFMRYQRKKAIVGNERFQASLYGKAEGRSKNDLTKSQCQALGTQPGN